ncbi:hypothetical protein [Saccharothrix variisporea]|uniref:hypothetical protein n=1 Tax=Saccharothrix variisporea TaxID=543527 RepID=UPI0011C44EDC|nr:hypothetical protein [Saccharothrix variisporea]
MFLTLLVVGLSRSDYRLSGAPPPSTGAKPSESVARPRTTSMDVGAHPTYPIIVPSEATPTHPATLPTPVTPTTADLSQPADDRQAFLEHQRRLLRQGQVAYRSPDPMRVDDVQRVVVRLGEQGLDITSGLPGSGSVAVSPVEIGSDVIAELSGPDFQITRVGGDDGSRVLVSRRPAEWSWDVRPLKSGTLTLDLVLYVRVVEGGAPLDVRTFQHRVSVEVNSTHWLSRLFKDYLAPVGLTVPVLVGGIAWGVSWWRKRRKGADSEAPTSGGDAAHQDGSAEQGGTRTGRAQLGDQKTGMRAEPPARTVGDRS